MSPEEIPVLRQSVRDAAIAAMKAVDEPTIDEVYEAVLDAVLVVVIPTLRWATEIVPAVEVVKRGNELRWGTVASFIYDIAVLVTPHRDEEEG